MPMFENKLVQLGLSEKEAKLYLLLQVGSSRERLPSEQF